jgi:hypothetical protein
VPPVRALLRNGAALDGVIVASRMENSPIRCAAGSNALHVAAFTGNIVMAKVLLEAQVSFTGAPKPSLSPNGLNVAWANALHDAPFTGNIVMAKVLLEAQVCFTGAPKPSLSPNGLYVSGSNAHHVTAFPGNLVMARVLLEAQVCFTGASKPSLSPKWTKYSKGKCASCRCIHVKYCHGQSILGSSGVFYWCTQT